MMIILLSSLSLLLILLLTTFLLRKRKLDLAEAKKINLKIQKTKTLDPNHSLIESHKILVASVEKMLDKKNQSAAKLLNKVSKRFPEEKEFWRFHRMRNKVAHELDYRISAKEAESARQNFKKAIKSLCS